MLTIKQKLTHCENVNTTLKLPFEKRQKSRFKVVLEDGREAGLFLPRGEVLRDGDYLLADDQSTIQIEAAEETVSQVQCHDPLLLARACYHLGNRHVALQIDNHQLRYLHDHVLDEMLAQLGLIVTICQASFEPENGAYRHHHSHGAHSHGENRHSHE